MTIAATPGSRPLPISVIVLTKNEESGLGITLDRLRDFDDVTVVDSHSTDATATIARDAGASVVEFTWDGGYPKKKQWSLDHVPARHPWVLLLDADEYPTDELVEELARLVAGDHLDDHSAFDISLSYRFAGRFLQHGHRVTKRSLLDPTRCRFPEVDDLDLPGIREVEGHYQPETSGRVGRTKALLKHDDRDPVASWFDRHNKYSDWEAVLRSRAQTRRLVASKRSRKGQIFDRVPAKSTLFFLYSYLFRLGFLDGRAGYDYARALSNYYWQIGVKERELRR